MGDTWRSFAAAALVLLTVLSSAAGYCRQGSEWIEYNGNCYHWSRAVSNWFYAELSCQQAGGHLVSIKSLSDNNFLLRLTQCSSVVWIGMVNTVHSLKGSARGFEWWDRTPHNYTVLAAQTNDYYDCVYFHPNGKWYNYPCQLGYGHVCMSPAVSHHQGSLDQDKLHGSIGQSAENKDQAAIGEQQDAEAVYWWTTMPPEVTSTEPAWPRSTPSPNRCQSSWQLMDNNCYFVSHNRTNYFNAQMSCQALGGNVASVLTLREHTLLTVALGCNAPTWIGLEKARPCFKQPNKDHCWVWMDRSPTNYFEWASGQTTDRRDAECVIIDGQWKVVNCYAEYPYVCKRAAQ